jgi:hypothetical protein
MNTDNAKGLVKCINHAFWFFGFVGVFNIFYQVFYLLCLLPLSLDDPLFKRVLTVRRKSRTPSQSSFMTVDKEFNETTESSSLGAFRSVSK